MCLVIQEWQTWQRPSQEKKASVIFFLHFVLRKGQLWPLLVVDPFLLRRVGYILPSMIVLDYQMQLQIKDLAAVFMLSQCL
jgi:hypothetical protein